MKITILKFLILCITLFTLLGVSAFAYSNVPSVAGDEIINVIKLLEIANGDSEGNMNFDKEVTRAEFVKMVINASKSKEAAANIKLNVSLFPDVKNSFWGAGYISVAINNGLVNGYMDGTFKPGNNVTLEEAATIVLRLLGYTNSDLVGSYPTAQLQKYRDLMLDENISAERGDVLTREECMILIYNALSADTKQGNTYCTSLGIAANKEGKVDYSALLEEKLDGPVIVKDVSSMFENTSFSENEQTKYILNNAKSEKTQIKADDVIYYSDIINTVFAYRKTATGIVNSSNASSVSISGKNYDIATSAAKDKLSLGGKFNEAKSFVTLILGINDTVVDVVEGDVDKISDNENNASRLEMIDATISKGVYIKDFAEASDWQSKIPMDTENAEIYLNGAKAETPEILAHDVIYYSKAFNSIWVYRKTVSGIIESITPENSPSNVTLSGKTYSISNSDAKYDLSVFGSYSIGDTVTLVLGINDECIAVTDTENVSGIIYGVVTAIGEKNYKDKNGDDYTADCVTVADTAGNTYTYEHDNRYLKVGDAVRVAVSGDVNISRLSGDLGKGNIVLIIDALKNGKFADDCEIIDVKGAEVIKVKPERLSGVELSYDAFLYSTIVLYYEFDENGNISKLILSNFTGDIDEYGIITSYESGKVKYMTDKTVKNMTTEASGLKVGPARIIKEDGTVSHAVSLLACVEDVQAFTKTAIYDENDREYLLSDNVKVFVKNIESYEYTTLDKISGGNYTYKAYYDKDQKSGGRIRVIIASRKI